MKPVTEWTNDDLTNAVIEQRAIDAGRKGKICITGKFDTGKRIMSRQWLKNQLYIMGWEYTEQITKDTKILFCDDMRSTSSKMLKAKKWGVKIVFTKPDFLQNTNGCEDIRRSPELYIGNLLHPKNIN